MLEYLYSHLSIWKSGCFKKNQLYFSPKAWFPSPRASRDQYERKSEQRCSITCSRYSSYIALFTSTLLLDGVSFPQCRKFDHHAHTLREEEDEGTQEKRKNRRKRRIRIKVMEI
ncbi:hypothetical protein E2C01_102132 [Portunus trituberculatus]|uniref:Uncharacterized protein n=1 Tax=Portunus trituberculatus TaxID=210409 RepID=A0A5B7KHM8_PORTR|nr:hypothetical protein [Portunus trituberculatus]